MGAKHVVLPRMRDAVARLEEKLDAESRELKGET